MEKPEKELIKEIADLFEDYEEAYVPGEWEAFAQKKKKRYPFLITMLTVAAALVIIVSVMPGHVGDLFKSGSIEKPVQLSKSVTDTSGVLPEHDAVPVTDHKERLAVPGQAPRPGVQIAGSTIKAGSPLSVASVALPAASPVIAMLEPRKTDSTVTTAQAVLPALTAPSGIMLVQISPVQKAVLKQKKLSLDTMRVIQKEKMTTMEFLAAESRAPEKPAAKKDQLSKWDFGVEVSPTMTRSNMNIGGGLTTAYRLSDKFSLSSGLSLLQLESGMDIPPSAQSKMAVSSLSSKELLAVDANIKAIDIPLAVVYQLNKHFYTSAGISYFNVISEKRNNTYQQASASSQSYADPVTGFSSDVRTVITQALSEPVTETRLKGNSYLGFFNFSIGRRQSLFNKYNILIEPFIKIPVGKLSTEDLKLTNSGLKFQLSF